VEKCGRAKQATDASITRRMRFACWITKTSHTRAQLIASSLIYLDYWNVGLLPPAYYWTTATGILLDYCHRDITGLLPPGYRGIFRLP
jgi:hypothetical protein